MREEKKEFKSMKSCTTHDEAYRCIHKGYQRSILVQHTIRLTAVFTKDIREAYLYNTR
jgi:hypothetical protein